MSSFPDSPFAIWRPSVPVSIDDEPLATTVADLFWNFPYDRLPQNRFVTLFLRPECVLGWVFFYLFVSKPLLKTLIKTFGITGKSQVFKISVALHNLALALFSFVVAVNAWRIVIQHIREYGWENTYCHAGGTFWDSGHGAWATIFYISKYYEFADTWVLVLKGKKPSFLQIYHHAGIVLTMWGGVLTESAWLLWIVILNSVIHTVMYVYFFLKTLFPDIEIPAAKYLTKAQITQFYTGILCSSGTYILGERCASAVSRLILLVLHLYAVGLIVLFVSFAEKKYKKP